MSWWYHHTMNTHELTTLLHELISEQNKCDSELYFDKNTNFDKRDIIMKKILDLNKSDAAEKESGNQPEMKNDLSKSVKL
ncbi:protein of unknown function [Nitrosotalea devaniterrae]|uniref:Uncharacterized protein n=1 Tax=Nitrosotalea devaniterrae TaxID=1078905 RepID=A0A128A2H7_9ARCH|nr:protein of unknown function [Candidatus Nitrosotalea devanaterra]